MIDVHSATWRSVEKWADEQIDKAVGRLKQTGLDWPNTEFERGYIAALEQLKQQGNPPPRIDVEAVRYDD